jgi:DNA-binding MarR family transcriptional regulator
MTGAAGPIAEAPETTNGSRTADEASAAAHLAPWRTFLLAHARITRRLDEELRAEHGLSLAEYEALLQIAYAPSRRLRMSQLAERVLLSRSGVTRLIDRLVADRFVERVACESDARGAEAVLTELGLERLRAAARTHVRGIDQYFLSVLPDDELDVIEHALGEVADRAGRSAIADFPPDCTPDGTATPTTAGERSVIDAGRP